MCVGGWAWSSSVCWRGWGTVVCAGGGGVMCVGVSSVCWGVSGQ